MSHDRPRCGYLPGFYLSRCWEIRFSWVFTPSCTSSRRVALAMLDQDWDPLHVGRWCTRCQWNLLDIRSRGQIHMSSVSHSGVLACTQCRKRSQLRRTDVTIRRGFCCAGSMMRNRYKCSKCGSSWAGGAFPNSYDGQPEVGSRRIRSGSWGRVACMWIVDRSGTSSLCVSSS